MPQFSSALARFTRASASEDAVPFPVCCPALILPFPCINRKRAGHEQVPDEQDSEGPPSSVSMSHLHGTETAYASASVPVTCLGLRNLPDAITGRGGRSRLRVKWQRRR